MKLTIGTDTKGKAFTLGLDLTTQTIAILAKKGAGKSYTAAIFNEEMLDAGQVPVIIDPTGAHWGLKSSADGKSEGYPVVIFGGEHPDLPLDESSGEATARVIVEQRFPAIIDLSLFRKAQVRRFITPFLETLYRLNRLPLMLVVDEADDICPQKPFGDEAQMVGALEDVVKRGRKKGIGCTLITQRPADLAKQVLTQCEVLVAMRLVHPLDIKAVMEWVHVHADEKSAADMVASLPSLPIGTAWFWSPGWGDMFERIKVRERKTFDSGATPKPGEKFIEPKKRAEINIVALGAEIAATAERAKANDPKALQARVRQLEAEIKNTPAQIETKVETVEVPAISEESERLLERFEAVAGNLSTEAQQLTHEVHSLRLDMIAAMEKFSVPNPTPVKIERKVIVGSASKTQPAPRVSRINEGLDGTQQAILDIVATLNIRGIDTNRDSVARWLDLHPTGGRYGSNLAFLRAEGYMDGFTLTDRGMKAARPHETGYEACKRPLDGTQCDILEVLKNNPGKRFSRESLAEALDLHPTGGRYGSNLARLRTMQLIPDRGDIYLTEAAER